MSDQRSLFLFVGERRSPLAVRRGLVWADGRLAARPLFRALEALGIDPRSQRFANLFADEGPRVALAGTLAVVQQAAQDGLCIVALGRRVAATLRRRNVPHVALVHPAARGRIRRRQRYAAHVRSLLGPLVTS